MTNAYEIRSSLQANFIQYHPKCSIKILSLMNDNPEEPEKYRVCFEKMLAKIQR